MIYPTAAEIDAAYRAIDAEGPNSETTAALALICLKTRLNGNVQRMAEAMVKILHLDDKPNARTAIEAMLSGAVITGLNYGLRIGEERKK